MQANLAKYFQVDVLFLLKENQTSLAGFIHFQTMAVSSKFFLQVNSLFLYLTLKVYLANLLFMEWKVKLQRDLNFHNRQITEIQHRDPHRNVIQRSRQRDHRYDWEDRACMAYKVLGDSLNYKVVLLWKSRLKKQIAKQTSRHRSFQCEEH